MTTDATQFQRTASFERNEIFLDKGFCLCYTREGKIFLLIEGAEIIKIGFTGDLPPIDLTLADGSPAGFNTAVLSELGKRMGRNIELVPITSGSRATALESRAIDVVFWAVVPAENVANPRPADIDRPKGLVMTKPYFTDKITHVALKK